MVCNIVLVLNKELNMNILIVENEVIPANYLTKMLTQEGYQVIDIVDTGADAIKMAKEHSFDLVLMDIMLNDSVSGCDAALEICKLRPKVMIVFLTAYSDKEMIEYAAKSCAFAYLLKPYRDKEILATMHLAKAKLDSNRFSISPQKDVYKLVLADGYIFNTNTKLLYYKDELVNIGPKALKLIDLLCKNKNNFIYNEDIIDFLWHQNKSHQTLRSLIHRIRTKTSSNLIVSVSKLGYKIGLEKDQDLVSN